MQDSQNREIRLGNYLFYPSTKGIKVGRVVKMVQAFKYGREYSSLTLKFADSNSRYTWKVNLRRPEKCWVIPNPNCILTPDQISRLET